MSRDITKASLIWGSSIALSRLIGLVREGVFGRMFGAGAEADAYWSAFIIPDFLNYLLAGGALSIVFIPIFAGHLARKDERAAWESFSAIAGFVTVVLGVLTIFLWVGMPALVPLIAPGFDAEQQLRVVELTRIVLPAQLFHVIGGLLAAALQARGRHEHAALAPLVYNVVIIVGGLCGHWFGGASHGAEGFAWGVLAGSALGPFLLPWIGCRKTGLRWSFGLDPSHPDLRTYLARSLPIMLGFSIVVVDDWYLRREGSRVGAGAVSTLSYAKTLMKVPIGIFGLAASVAAYPTLARLAAEKRLGELRATLLSTLRPLIVLALAAQVVLSVAGREIVSIVYGRRLLEPSQVHEINTCLTLVSLGLVAWTVQSVLARGFYALGNTWLPALLGTAVALFAYPVYAFGRSSGGMHGLAFVSSIAIVVYVAALVWKLHRALPERASGEAHDLRLFVARVAVPTAVGWGAGTLVHLFFSPSSTLAGALFQLALLSCVSMLAFGFTALQLGLPEALRWRDQLRELLARRAAA